MLGDGGEAVVVHPADMSVWADISCQRGHVRHADKPIHVDLAERHQYHDYEQVPARLAYAFDMQIWDWSQYGDGPYCPAHDAVSETIETIGIWEPIETILALQVFSTAALRQSFLDLGSQIGWFTHLAFHHGLTIDAYDADADCVNVLSRQFAAADWVNVHYTRIDDSFTLPQLSTSPIRLAKMDLEGAERHAIAALWPAITDGQVDHILMEVSPCFNSSYPELLDSLLGVGYELYALPEKQIPPRRLDDPAHDLARIARVDIRDFVESFQQADVWLKHKDASW